MYAAKKGVIDRLRGKSKGAAEVIEAQSVDWVSRGGQPYDLQEWLDDRAWLPDEVARLLGCTDDQAAALLWAFGFEKSPSGLWRKNEDAEAKLLGNTMNLAIRGYVHAASDDELRAVIRDEVDHYLTSGEARDVDHER